MTAVGGPRARGVFIVIEGVDGAGTTTQTRLVSATLRERGLPVHATREPSDGPIGTFLRQSFGDRSVLAETRKAEVLAALFAADRLDHAAREIDSALMRGEVVISDRYDLSTYAYQLVLSGLSGEPAAVFLRWLHQLNLRSPRPDVVVVLDVSASVATARLRTRGGRRDLFEDEAIQEMLVEAYDRASELLPAGTAVVHLAGRQSERLVTSDVLYVIQSVLMKAGHL